jgi:DNA-directed RNA polymerase alpha subunit
MDSICTSQKFYTFSDDIYRVRFRQATLRMVNDVRRIMMSQIQTLAIDIIRIHENKTSIQDEIIAHRLGLLPIDLRGPIPLRDSQTCECADFCSHCAIPFSLTVKPVRTTHPQLVSHLDLKISGSKEVQVPFSSHPIPLFLLQKGESLNLEGAIRWGKPCDHAKWSPVAGVGIFSPDEISPTDGIDEDISVPSHIMEREYSLMEKKDYILQFETTGLLSASEIV